MAVGFIVGVVVHSLIAVVEAHGVFLVDFPISPGGEADFLQVPGIESLHTDVWRGGNAGEFVLVFSSPSEQPS